MREREHEDDTISVFGLRFWTFSLSITNSPKSSEGAAHDTMNARGDGTRCCGDWIGKVQSRENASQGAVLHSDLDGRRPGDFFRAARPL